MLTEGKRQRLIVLLLVGLLLTGIVCADEAAQSSVPEESSTSKTEEVPKDTLGERFKRLTSKVCGDAEASTKDRCLKKAASTLNFQKRISGVGCILNPSSCNVKKE